MKGKIIKSLLLTFGLAFLLVTGCSTMAIKTPPGMYLSTGDYVAEVETIGILQVSITQFCPLFIYDLNRIRMDLYEELIRKAEVVGADGVTNVQFYYKLSPLTYFSAFIVSGIFDFYMEGVAIVEK